MGKVNGLHNKVKPFAVLFWALGIVYLPTPDPAHRPGITPLPYTLHKACTYMVIVGSNLIEDALPPPPFPT